MSKTKEITLDSFKKLLENNLWEHQVYFGREIEENDDSTLEWTGWVECISSLDNIDIHHYLEFSYSDGDLNSFKYSYENLDKPEWVVNGITVLDEKGEYEIDEWGIYSELFDKFDIKNHIKSDALTKSKINYNHEESINEWHTIENSGIRIAFNGHTVASKVIVNVNQDKDADDQIMLAIIYKAAIDEIWKSQYITEYYSPYLSKEESLGSVCHNEEQVRLFFSQFNLPAETIDVLCVEAGF